MAYGSGAGAYAAIAQATKASGVIVRLEPQEFLAVLNWIKDPLIVTSKSGWPASGHQYLTSFKGLAFYTKSSSPLVLPGMADIITAQSIWIP
ncbi:MAG: hypothetical protein QY871_05860 [Dehalococcoides mccartyi]|uniref:hypothetical protein n=1 Tax=Dehalococcoides mccartyi TaxID=61435 RepID=UPI0025CAD6E4|nr:hypothetical protein [Dehalococcoides mccartyi]MDN4186573.1 hypothetical protein [Dehalococcoides mccartyi]